MFLCLERRIKRFTSIISINPNLQAQNFELFIINYIYFLFFYVRLSYFYFLEFVNEKFLSSLINEGRGVSFVTDGIVDSVLMN